MNNSHKKKYSGVLLCCLFLLAACGGGSSSDPVTVVPPPVVTDPPPTTSTLNILTLGDSRVAGAPPNYESYRYELWKNLVVNDWDFDLIGPFVDTFTYPTFNNQTFDADHAGAGGATTQNILDNLPTVLADIDTPDVVLLGIGGNDLFFAMLPTETVLTNIDIIIDQLQAANSDVTIFVEQIAPARSDIMTAQSIAILNNFNTGIFTLAAQQTDTLSKVIAVDMNSDWQDSYMADTIHYSVEGAKAVADRYYIAIDENITQ